MQTVIFKKIAEPSYDTVSEGIRSIFDASGLNPAILGGKCLLKINAMSREVLPGRNTSPWVLEAVLAYLVEKFHGAEFIIVDSDVAGYRQFRQACANWGYDAIASKYDVKIINLAEEEVVARTTGNPLCPKVEFPKLVMEVDSIINMPVLKTHMLSGITCCLKNHWGLLPRFRYQHHPILAEVIAEINKQITRTVYNIVDGTVCIEGSGPKTGKSRICSVLFGGADRVAVDAAVLKFAAIPIEMAEHILVSQSKGVGSVDFEITGDSFIPVPFERPIGGGDLVSLVEKKLRSIPLVGPFLYRPSIARVLGYMGTKYNEIVWFNFHGRRYIRTIVMKSPYQPEFAALVK